MEKNPENFNLHTNNNYNNYNNNHNTNYNNYNYHQYNKNYNSKIENYENNVKNYIKNYDNNIKNYDNTKYRNDDKIPILNSGDWTKNNTNDYNDNSPEDNYDYYKNYKKPLGKINKKFWLGFDEDTGMRNWFIELNSGIIINNKNPEYNYYFSKELYL